MKIPTLKFLSLPMRSQTGKIFGQIKLFALPLITLAVFLGVVVLAGPRISTILELSKSIKVLDEKRLVLKEKSETLSSLEGSDLRSKVIQIEKSLPSQKDIPGLLFSIDKLAADNGVFITSIQLSPGEITATSSAVAQASKLPIKLSIAGGYEGIKSFLSQAISTNRILKVTRANLTAAQSSASISASLEVETYFLPLETVRFSTGDPLPKISAEEEKALERARLQPDFSQLPFGEKPPPGGRPNPFERF